MMARAQHLVLSRTAPARAPARPYARVRRHRRWLVPLLVAMLLAQMAAAMVTTAVRQTPTIDEPVYVATATDYLHEHRIRYNPEHPPLGKLLIEAGVAVAGPHYDPSYPGTQGDVGRHLLYESGNDPWRLMLWARLPVIALTLLCGLVAFAFARELTGTAGGLVALALYAFSPDLIAHGSLATLDMPAAGFVLTSAWLVWWARRRPALYLPLAGAALGAAVATKMSTLPAVPVLMGLAVVSVLAAGRDRAATPVDGTDSGTGTGTGTGRRFTRGGREDDTLRRTVPSTLAGPAGGRRRRALSALVGPVGGRRRTVLSLLAGMAGGRRYEALSTPVGPAGSRRRTDESAHVGPARDGRRRDLAPRAGTAGGRWRRVSGAAGGAGVMGLVAVGVVWVSYLAVDPRLRFSPAEPVPALHGLRGRLVGLLPLPPAYRAGMRVQFAFEDQPWQGYLFGHLYTGSRWYYLPAALLVKTPLGLLALGAAGAVALVAVRRLRPAAPYLLLPPGVLLAAAMTGARDFGTRYALFVPVFLAVTAACVPAGAPWPGRRRTAAVTAALVLWTAVSSLRTFPYYLPYANEAFGGPAQTHRLLHDSNVDWGQDLGRLADRLRREPPGERVWLVYKGSGVPSYYGIRAADPRDVPADRVHGLLVVSDSAVAKARGKLAELIASSHPVGDVGHSISLYRR